jgi:hypothetical protein
VWADRKQRAECSTADPACTRSSCVVPSCSNCPLLPALVRCSAAGLVMHVDLTLDSVWAQCQVCCQVKQCCMTVSSVPGVPSVAYILGYCHVLCRLMVSVHLRAQYITQTVLLLYFHHVMRAPEISSAAEICRDWQLLILCTWGNAVLAMHIQRYCSTECTHLQPGLCPGLFPLLASWIAATQNMQVDGVLPSRPYTYLVTVCHSRAQ